MSPAHAGLTVTRREVIRPTAGLYHVVRGARYACQKVFFIGGEQPAKRRLGQSLMMAQHQCPQDLFPGHLENSAAWEGDARRLQFRNGIGPTNLAADGECAGTGPASCRMGFAEEGCRRSTGI
jgi:hypothetical protein